MDTFDEAQAWGTTTYQVMPGSRTSFKTQRQQVDLITNPCFGRMLFLDGVLQSATADELVYHRALTHSQGRSYETALILGGSEGAVAREVFATQPDVKKVVMVDWDAELVSWMHLKEADVYSTAAAFIDPRLEYVSEDVNIFLSRGFTLFDTVFVDLLDPDEETWQWLATVIIKCVARLSPGGWMGVNLGSNKKVANRIVSHLHQNCWMWTVTPFRIFVPSFQEPWILAHITSEQVLPQSLIHDDWDQGHGVHYGEY